MRKFRLFMDKDKETAWLNEMAAEGWKLTGFCLGVYSFDACEKGKYTYQLDFWERNKNGAASYDAFMKEMNIHVVCTWFVWTYLCKETADGPFELYTDNESRITHYTRIRNWFKIGAAIEFSCALIEFLAAIRTNDLLFVIFGILLSLLGAVITSEAYHTSEKLREMKGLPKRQSDKRSRLIAVGCLGFNCLMLLINRTSLMENVVRDVFLVLGACLIGIAIVAIFRMCTDKKSEK